MSISPAAPAARLQTLRHRPAPAEVVVAVLSTEGDGTASPELLAAVAEAVNDEDVRPMGIGLRCAAPRSWITKSTSPFTCTRGGVRADYQRR